MTIKPISSNMQLAQQRMAQLNCEQLMQNPHTRSNKTTHFQRMINSLHDDDDRMWWLGQGLQKRF